MGRAPGLGAGWQGSAAPWPHDARDGGLSGGPDDAGGDFQEGRGGPAECSLCDLREEGTGRRKGSAFKCNLEETYRKQAPWVHG